MQRTDWFGVFGLWLAARFRYEFADTDWAWQVHEGSARVSAAPKDTDVPRVYWSLPEQFLERPPYVVAAQAAAELRVRAEEIGVLPRRRTLSPPSDLGGRDAPGMKPS